MTLAKTGRIILILLGTGLLFLGLLYLFFPLDRVNAALASQLEAQGVKITPAASKSVLPGLFWQQATLSSMQGSLVYFDRISLHPDWRQLFSGSAALSLRGASSSGRFDLSYGFSGRKLIGVTIHDMNLQDIPFFKTSLGAEAAGMLWSEGAVVRGNNGAAGEIRLEVKNLALKGVKLGMFPLPDVSGLTAQGMVRIAGGKARLESFTLQGDGVYMRLSGDLPSGAAAVSSPLNLSLDIMPKPEFLEKQKLVFLLLAKFATSPGVYQIPVRGSLLKPEIL